jgi:hypothetical protein
VRLDQPLAIDPSGMVSVADTVWPPTPTDGNTSVALAITSARAVTGRTCLPHGRCSYGSANVFLQFGLTTPAMYQVNRAFLELTITQNATALPLEIDWLPAHLPTIDDWTAGVSPAVTEVAYSGDVSGIGTGTVLLGINYADTHLGTGSMFRAWLVPGLQAPDANNVVAFDLTHATLRLCLGAIPPPTPQVCAPVGIQDGCATGDVCNTPCCGDCDNNRVVTALEEATCWQIQQGTQYLGACPMADCDNDGHVTRAECDQVHTNAVRGACP